MIRRHFIHIGSVALGGLALDACARAASLHPADASTPTPAPVDAATFTRARRFASTPFGEIAYVDYGSGPAALFIHGYPLNGFQWRGAIARLAGARRSIAPDLMGLGFTNIAATQAITPETQVSMLLALLDTLRIDTCDVLGNDSGGMIAQLLVMRAPHRVRSLLLTNCDTEPDCPPRSFLPFVRLARAGGLADKTIAPALADKAAARGPRGLGGIGYSSPLDPTDEAIDMYFAPIVSSAKRKAQYDDLTIGLGKNALANSKALLRQYTGPVRIVWGADDTVFAQSSPAWLDQIFPNSRGVRLVQRAKLFFPEERPDLIATEARRLWSGQR
jgi:pimeloyl-ACP methyl ester carboxylesterase